MQRCSCVLLVSVAVGKQLDALSTKKAELTSAVQRIGELLMAIDAMMQKARVVDACQKGS